jgi:hypothetical protein
MRGSTWEVELPVPGRSHTGLLLRATPPRRHQGRLDQTRTGEVAFEAAQRFAAASAFGLFVDYEARHAVAAALTSRAPARSPRSSARPAIWLELP